MLVTSEMNKKSVEIVTEHFPRLPGNEIKIGELFYAFTAAVSQCRVEALARCTLILLFG